MGRRCRRSNASRNVRHRRKFKFFHIFELWRYIGRTILAHTVAKLGQRWGSGGRAQRIERRTPRRTQASKETNTVAIVAMHPNTPKPKCSKRSVDTLDHRVSMLIDSKKNGVERINSVGECVRTFRVLI